MRRSSGFTLLEVLVALTLTGLALGGLFSVIAGSKRLAWRAEDALVHSMQVRSLINFAQLNDEQGEVSINFTNRDLKLVSGEELEVPDRKTIATMPDLRGFHVDDENGETIAGGSYWIQQDVATQGDETPIVGGQPFDLRGTSAPSPIRRENNPNPPAGFGPVPGPRQ